MPSFKTDRADFKIEESGGVSASCKWDPLVNYDAGSTTVEFVLPAGIQLVVSLQNWAQFF